MVNFYSSATITASLHHRIIRQRPVSMTSNSFNPRVLPGSTRHLQQGAATLSSCVWVLRGGDFGPELIVRKSDVTSPFTPILNDFLRNNNNLCFGAQCGVSNAVYYLGVCFMMYRISF